MGPLKILEPFPLRRANTRADWYGILCSSLCLLHCSVIPLLLWVLPVLSETHWLGQPIFHQCAALVCAGMVIQSIVPGYLASGSPRIALLAGTGLAMVLTSAFILPDACCTIVEPEFVPRSIHASEILPRTFPAELEFCSYFGDVGDGLHGPPDPRHLVSPMITIDQLQFGLGVTNMRRWQIIQPWLPRCGGLLLILAHGLNHRVLRHCQTCCCGK